MGGADSSGDGRVSLSEAYAYAYDRTVADTADTAAGPQHPTFSYDLAGNGDVILTEFAARREGVVLPADAPEGSYFLVDARGVVAVEIAKASGVERRIALATGDYKIKRRLSDHLRIGELAVKAGETTVLSEGALHDAPFSDDPVKGGLHAVFEPEPPHFGLSLGGGYQYFFSGPFPSMPVLNVEAALRYSFVWTLDFGYGFGSSSIPIAGDSLAYRFNEIALGVSFTKEWEFGRLSPYMGARIAVLILGRSFEDASVPHQSFVAMTPGLVAGLRLRIARHFALAARVRGHYLYYNVDSAQSLGYLEGALVLSAEL